ncbi:GNAT family N-acetyltransferase [Yoonia litorea]|uniref:Aminoglycoside 6'-N-acetyltransferase n=1 Tax=Yoonia litorea TaxID=1123755 RepID=A0A1I6N2R0_9RHOB|nr:GNAT family N-acetyltransferase [Yoonia litorea]SFS22131.1 aminoglycoside 6'-N-acetyltransferase [Yoonia litorea]
MTRPPKYSFRQATPADLLLLADWRKAAHVARWWGEGESYSQEDLAEPRVTMMIVSLDDRPFAYMQDYTVHGWDDHHFAGLPHGSRGIDQFIGPSDMIGKGHGPAFIAQRVHSLFEAGAPVVATDPHPDNASAIRAYEKAGFAISGQPQDTAWGRIVPMLAHRLEAMRQSTP